MSSTAIDQLLQTPAPLRAASESGTTVASKNEHFQEHLQRATHDAHRPQETVSKRSHPEIQDENTEPTKGNEDGATSEQDGPAVTTESVELNGEQAEAVIREDEAAEPVNEDELSISEEADAATDATAQAEAGNLPTQTQSDHLDKSYEKLPAEHGGDEELNTQAQPSNQLAVEEHQPKNPEQPVLATVSGNGVESSRESQAGEHEQVSEDGESKVKATDQLESEGKNSTSALAANTDIEQKKTDATKKSVARDQTKDSTVVQHAAASQGEFDSRVDNDENAAPRRDSSIGKPGATRAPKPSENLGIAELLEETPSNAKPPSTIEGNPSPAVASGNSSNEITNDLVRTTDSVTKSDAASVNSSHIVDEPLETTSRARFVGRVSGAIRSAQTRDGKIQLRLSPPELGTLRIEITVNQGAVTAHLETENASARNLLLDSLPALRERLAEQEIRIEKFDVDVRRDNGGQHEKPGSRDRPDDRPQPHTGRAPRSDRQQQTSAASVENLLPTSAIDSALDVRI